MLASSLLVAIILAMVHLFGGRLAIWMSDSHHRWLSVGGGVTVAFVFLYLLPELEYFHQVLSDHGATDLVEELLYLTGLVGVTIYYSLEHLAFRVRESSSDQDDDKDSPLFGHDYVFWLHMGWYGVYNIIIGALLSVGTQETTQGLWLYGVAIAIHFLTVDASMRSHHRHVYHRTGRWLLAAAVIVGWGLGVALTLPPEMIALAMGFLFGGLLINSIKDELPSSDRARVFPFLVGVVVASVLLVLI